MYKLSDTCQIKNLNQIYLEYFGLFPHNRTFVEVGAYDGESVSNTSGLADAGWKGFYIEPVHSIYLKCLDRHRCNNVIVSNFSIGLEEGIQKIYTNGILSSLDKEHASFGITKFNYPNYEENICYQMRLDKFLNNYSVPKYFDLLVVDVEGKEHEVFSSFDLMEWKPKMIIVELVDDHQYFQDSTNIISRIQKLRREIESSGYTSIYRNDINTIFVIDDHI